ncbi:MAG: adenosylcobinamide-GDP ribazoletransferase [Alcanivoracaceae bacterium]|nr:adenosylcobinamide-GDP ribazoletransferase [Alcanivoracaceae bacterium]
MTAHFSRIEQPLKLALSLLTRIPVRVHTPVRDEDQAASVAFYPLIGLLIGVMLWLTAQLLIASNPFVVAVVVLMIWVGITGALHLDGLADSADAWLGGFGDKQRTLAIMKDPASGPAGVVAIVIVLLAKTAAISALIQQQNLLPLIIAPLLARAACSGLFLALPYVRENGLASIASQNIHHSKVKNVIQFSLITSALVAFLGGQWAMLITAAIVSFVGMQRMKKRVDGFTGDTAGAQVEVVEMMTLLVIVITT